MNYNLDKYGNKIPYGYNLMDIKYDGEKIVEVLFGYDGKIETKYNYEYDASGKLVTEGKTYAYGEPTVITYTYNEIGQILAEENGDSWYGGSFVYEYNDVGVKTVKTTTKSDYNKRWTYTYDSQNRLIEEMYSESNYYDEYYEREKKVYSYSDDDSMSYTLYNLYDGEWQEQYTVEYVYGSYYVYTVE